MTNVTILKAILAMDSYNRGYSENISLPTVTNQTKIGTATIISQSDIDPSHDPYKAGFYGIAYTYGAETIISYRGTNQLLDGNGEGGDIANGWLLGAGNYNAAQGKLAVQFYKDVAQSLLPF